MKKLKRTEDKLPILVGTVINIKQMDIIFFSLCCLYKLAFHVIIVDSGDDETGEKNCVLVILNFGSFHM